MVEDAVFIKSSETAILKRAVATILYRKNIEQSRISDLLNISQPMVSNYIGSKEPIPKNILEMANKISQKIIDGNSLKLQTCISFNDNYIEGHFLIAKENEIISDEKKRIIDNLTEAFILIKGKNISGLIPKVKINLAMTSDNAERTEDVAAFLNGLIIADDRILSNNGIRFGVSKHLSKLLLDLKRKIDVNAIMNIAFLDKIKNLDLSVANLTKEFILIDKKKQIDILLHKGDFGIEPCAYILGKNAVDVSKKLLTIAEGLKDEK
jgi:predicted fused transcriptional regulator/phosphomethylpyrimidine kinase